MSIFQGFRQLFMIDLKSRKKTSTGRNDRAVIIPNHRKVG